MALLLRVTARWSGGQIGTGFTNLFFTDGVSTAQAAADAARKFLNDALNAGASLPAGVTISFAAAIDRIEPATGVLVNTIPITAPISIVGSASGNYAALAGACVSWLTGDVVNGHRVIGRTFLVPLDQGSFQSDGTLGTSFVTGLNTAAATLIASAPEFVIWHRPQSIAVGDGTAHVVLASKVTDRAAMLTSRR